MGSIARLGHPFAMNLMKRFAALDGIIKKDVDLEVALGFCRNLDQRLVPVVFRQWSLRPGFFADSRFSHAYQCIILIVYSTCTDSAWAPSPNELVLS